VSAELSLVGIGGRFEYMLTPKFSVGANAYWSSACFIFYDIGFNGVARLYPWGKTFYGGLGLGNGTHTGMEPFTDESSDPPVDVVILTSKSGFDIVPELGWKIDVGQPGGFFLNPQIQLPLTLGKATEIGGTYEGDFGVSVGFRVALGLGWSF
jgi:hypothetical protein